MIEHITLLAAIATVRGFLGLVGGGFLIYKATQLEHRLYYPARVSDEIISFDSTAFTVGGAVLVAVSALFLIQGIGALRARPWARRLGLILSIVDLVSLILFPLSTALGLYGLVVYRHPDVHDWFEERGRPAEA